MDRRSRLGIAVLSAWFSCAAFCAGDTPAAPTPPTPPPMPALAHPPILAETRAAAERFGVPITDVNVRSEDTSVVAKDSLTFLVTSRDGKETRQWLVVLQARDATQKEKEGNPVAEQRLYTNMATEPVVFPKEDPAAMTIRTVGLISPDNGSRKAKETTSDTLVSPRFLGLGLHGAASLIARLKAGEDHGSIGFSNSPPAPQELKYGLDLRARAKITDNEIRGIASMGPALQTFFAIASRTEGVSGLVREIVDIPWTKFLLRGGRFGSINFAMGEPLQPLSAADWHLPEGTSVFSVGSILQLDGKNALKLVFAVTQPRAPLLCSAGIVGLVAARPDGTGPVMTLELIAARPAPRAQSPGP